MYSMRKKKRPAISREKVFALKGKLRGKNLLKALMLEKQKELLSPVWLKEAWKKAKHHGLEKLTLKEISEEISKFRQENKFNEKS